MNRTPLPPEAKAKDLLAKYGRRISKYIINEILEAEFIDTLTHEKIEGMENDNNNAVYWNKVKEFI